MCEQEEKQSNVSFSLQTSASLKQKGNEREGEERRVAGEHMVYGVPVSSPPSSPLFSLVPLHT